jgi:hypothetical protein
VRGRKASSGSSPWCFAKQQHYTPVRRELIDETTPDALLQPARLFLLYDRGGDSLSFFLQHDTSTIMSWEIPAPTADAARSEARWSFYDLLDDYKQVLETNPVAAGTNAVSEPPNTRRVQSAPPLGEPAPIASAPLARSSSANPIDRRVRFAGDGLVRIHHFVPIPASNDAGEVTGVLPVTEEDDGAVADDEDADVSCSPSGQFS